MNRRREEEKAKQKSKQKKRKRKSPKRKEPIERGREWWPRKWRILLNCFEQRPERVARYE